MVKKRLIFLSILFLLAVFYFASNLNSQAITGSTVTGSTITGEATSAGASLSIILTGGPSLNLIKPKNETYFTHGNLQLRFIAGSAQYIWYNLNNGTNTTITGNTTFNTTQGQHTLYLFANNTGGNITSKNVTFTIDTNRFRIHYENYTGAFAGQSTNFNASSYEDIQNLSGIILENTNYGKIVFNQAINLTNDSDPADNQTDINSNVNVFSNLIDINTTALPNFNKSATLYLYNLNFTNPRILRDGSICPSTICTEISYSGGTFIFNVTQFTSYSAEETPGEIPPSGGGGGTTKQPGTEETELFTLDKNQITVSLNPGQIKTEYFTITNTGSQAVIFRIENLLTDFVLRGEDEVLLNPGESKTVPLHIFARVDTIPNLYLGKIIVTSGVLEKEILILVEVESPGILLDVRAEIIDRYLKVQPGEEILAEIRLFNLGGTAGRKDIEIEYTIRNDKNEIIMIEHEFLAIETQATFIKRINIPERIKRGTYVLYIKAIHEGKIASSSDTFEVVSYKISRESVYLIIASLLAIIILSYIIKNLMGKKFEFKKITSDEIRKKFYSDRY